MCTYNTISSHKYHLEIQKMDSEESLLLFVNLFSIWFETVNELGRSIVHCVSRGSRLEFSNLDVSEESFLST